VAAVVHVPAPGAHARVPAPEVEGEKRVSNLSLPDADLMSAQAQWLAEARAKLLRKAEIGRRKMVLDLGCGFGTVTSELSRRSAGRVVAIDQNLQAIKSIQNALRVCAQIPPLPFRDFTFDLIFSQNFFLWIPDLQKTIAHVRRVLAKNGVVVFLEPDYGGYMEYPFESELKELWIRALRRAGAEPFTGRKLTACLMEFGWKVDVELLPRLIAPSEDRYRLLEGLPLLPEEQTILENARFAAAKSVQIAHLPYYLISAT
jgi:SAM-dependent methyltransferase